MAMPWMKPSSPLLDGCRGAPTGPQRASIPHSRGCPGSSVMNSLFSGPAAYTRKHALEWMVQNGLWKPGRCPHPRRSPSPTCHTSSPKAFPHAVPQALLLPPGRCLPDTLSLAFSAQKPPRPGLLPANLAPGAHSHSYHSVRGLLPTSFSALDAFALGPRSA